MIPSGTSRTLAANLRALAEWLDSKPEFPMTDVRAKVWCVSYGTDKDGFLAAVKALGSGKKEPGILDSELRFRSTACPPNTEVEIEVTRKSVCRLVRPAQPAVWDCESLLSAAEEAQIGA